MLITPIYLFFCVRKKTYLTRSEMSRIETLTFFLFALMILDLFN
jgi:hypothetical protein